QGGSVISALLAHSGYTIRGLTRDPHSPSSQALGARGVEMVAASLADPASLVSAFKGAYAVFGVTIPWSKENETQQGKIMVDACLADRVQLFLWSSQPSAAALSKGKYTIRSMEDKAAVDEYIKAVGQPAVFFWLGA
ncbi:NAD(P)-binding protein, partial [Calocera viscosa TUFC12733]